MGTKVVQVKTRNGALAGWNVLGENTYSAGLKFANLLDNAGLASGISLTVTGTFTSSGGSNAWATTNHHGLPVGFWQWSWYCTVNGGAAIVLEGFPVGQSVTLTLAAHNYNNTRHTDYIVNGAAPVRYNTINTATPTAPLILNVIADSQGRITITGNLVSTWWAFNGLTFSFATSPTITTLDRLTPNLLSTVTTDDSAFVATSASITSDGVTKVVAATDLGSGSFSFTPPDWTPGSTGLAYDAATVRGANAGVAITTNFNTTLAPPVGLTNVVLTSVSVYNYGRYVDFVVPLKIGSSVLYDATKCKVNADGTVDDNGTGNTEPFVILDRDPDTYLIRSSQTSIRLPGDPVVISMATYLPNAASPYYDPLFKNGNR